MADALQLGIFGGVGVSASPSNTNFTLNNSADKLVVIFQTDAAITITHLGYRQGTTTSSPVWRISLQGVDASGLEDGTVKGGGTPASKTFSPGSNNTWQWQALDNSYTTTRGEWLAWVIEYSSGTIGGANNCSFTSTASAHYTFGQPYCMTYDADTTTRSRLSTMPTFGYKSSTIAYGFPHDSLYVSSMSSVSNPDERGMAITIPSTWCSTYTINGINWGGTLAAAGACDCLLYDTDGTAVLQQVSFDWDYDAASSGGRSRHIAFDETTLSTLNAGSTYFITVRPTTGSLVIYGILCAAANDLTAYSMGTQFQGCSKVDAGAMTTSNLTRYMMWPTLGDITAPSSGGGVVVRRGGTIMKM